MKLNDDQIQDLFNFTEKKLVHFYDLQIELVDHLATRIEEKMEQDKKLTFEKALRQVYDDFGIFGFSQVVREKTKQLERTHFRLWWKEVLRLFRWPQIVGLLTILAVFYTLSMTISNNYLRIVFGVLALVGFILDIRQLRRKTKPKKAILLLQYYQPGIGFFWCYGYLQFLVHVDNPSALLFTAINFLFVVSTLSLFHLNKKIKKEAMELYPEAFA